MKKKKKTLKKVNPRAILVGWQFYVAKKYKVAIADLKRGTDVAGSDFGTFSLRVLVNNPRENNDNEIVEEFTNLSLE